MVSACAAGDVSGLASGDGPGDDMTPPGIQFSASLTSSEASFPS